MKRSVKGPIYLFLCSLLWGLAFAAQSNAAKHVEPYTFVFVRSIITFVLLSAAYPFLRRIGGESSEKEASNKKHLLIGALCGVFLVLANLLQQIGIASTTAAKSGFITALYIVIVPILGLFLGKKPSAALWISVIVSLVGLYFLCMKEKLDINTGDLFTFACALAFAVHILLVDRFGQSLNSIKFSAIQFGTAAILSGILALIFETPNIDSILVCWKDVLYIALFSTTLGYTFQIIGQKYTDATLASLILCLESVFAAIGGWIVLGETLSGREILGCALMLSASAIAQIPAKSR